MNALITSISKKVPLIQTVKNSLQHFKEKTLLFGADSNPECIGKYFVDKFWNIPNEVDLTLDDVLNYCKKFDIRFIIPTRNGELLLWSKFKPFLYKHHIYVLVSDTEALKTCLDKQLFYEFLKNHQIPIPETTQDILNLHCPLFVVKEKSGAGSKGIGLKLNRNEAILHAKKIKDPIFQPYISGVEYTIDMYIKNDTKIHGVIIRKRELIVDGESQITTTVQNQSLENLCINTALTLGLKGHILFQAIEDQNGQYWIIECNPRFGGASTLSIKAGLDSFNWFFLESLKKPLPEFKRSQQEIKLIRHAKDTFIDL